MGSFLILQLVSVSSALFALLLGIAAVATHDWIRVCTNECVHAGLLVYHFSFGSQQRTDFLVDSHWAIGQNASMGVAAAFMVAALAFLFIGLCFAIANLTTTFLGRDSAKMLCVGSVLISITVVLLLVGLTLVSSNKTLTKAEMAPGKTVYIDIDEEDLTDISNFFNLPSATTEDSTPTITADTSTERSTTLASQPSAPTTSRTTTATTTDVSAETHDPEFSEFYDAFDSGFLGDYFSRRRRSVKNGKHETSSRPAPTLRFGASYITAWVGFAMALVSMVTSLAAIYAIHRCSKSAKTDTKVPKTVTSEVTCTTTVA